MSTAPQLHHLNARDNRSKRRSVQTLSTGITALDALLPAGGWPKYGLIEINVQGVYNGMKTAVPYMKAQGGGSIINLASIVSTIGIPDRFAYTMSKGAVLTMTLSVATDYLNDNIRCNCVAPARVHTPFVDGFLKRHYSGREQEMFDHSSATQPIGRMGSPQEVADLALYLCSDEAAFATGTDYPIDGGFLRLNT